MSHTVSLDTWRWFLARYAEGGAFEAPVTEVMPFGAFVDLGDGVIGLLRRPEWVTEVLPDSRISVKIDYIDLERRRVSLIPA